MLTDSSSAPLAHAWPRPTAWRWAVSAIAASLVLVSAFRVDWAVIGAAFARAPERPAGVAAAVGGYFAAFWLRAVAWRWLSSSRPATSQLLSNLHVSLFLNHLMPFKAGEVARPALASRHGVPAREAVVSTVLARALDFVALALLALAFVPLANASGRFAAGLGAAVVFVASGATLLVLLRHGVPSFGSAFLAGRVASLAEGLRAVPAGAVLRVFPLVVLSWALEAGMVLVAADLLGHDLALRAAVGATAATILFQAVHLTPGGLGIYEAAMTAALVSFGMDGESAFAVAVLTHGLKFAYAFSAGAGFAAFEGVFLLRGRRGAPPKRASRFEVVAARLWNVVNEGKPFTIVFTLAVLGILWLPSLVTSGGWLEAGIALAAVAPLALLFWRFDFPLRLRAALWVYLVLFVLATRALPAGAAALVVSLYLGFTVVLWGTIYYHLRIGTAWTNGFRFVRLVFENPDPTSGNLLEQLPKVLLLVFAFDSVAGDASGGSVGLVLGFGALLGVTALLLHRWFFTWVPALPQPRIAPPHPPVPSRVAKRVIAIVIDGCRADRLLEANTPCIDRLRAEGADFRAMSTVYPARTVTCFSSMLTGASPAVHGMRSNFVPDLGVKCESVFDVLRSNGMRGKLVGIAHLIDAFGERDVRSVTAVMHNDEIDDALVEQAKTVLRDENPELLVLQLLSVDQTGHARGSYNAEYLTKIEETDRKIDSFLEWCRKRGFLEGATVILTADHGQGIGIGGHGHMTASEIRIPAVLWGEGIDAGVVDDRPRFITDFAPTICGLLGVAAPAESVGRDLMSACLPGAERPVVFVVPARNEAANLPNVLRGIAESGIERRLTVVVDDGSTDGTAEIARRLGAIVVSHERNRGLGAALRTGLAVARGLAPRAVVYLDGDGEYDAREARLLLAPIEAGEADYVLGSRVSGQRGGMTLSRRVANRAFSVATSLFAGRWISDGQTGFRAFSARAADVAEIVHDYNYAQVLTLDLVHKGMRLREVPITYRRRSEGRSFVSGQYLWRVPLGMMREMLRA